MLQIKKTSTVIQSYWWRKNTVLFSAYRMDWSKASRRRFSLTKHYTSTLVCTLAYLLKVDHWCDDVFLHVSCSDASNCSSECSPASKARKPRVEVGGEVPLTVTSLSCRIVPISQFGLVFCSAALHCGTPATPVSSRALQNARIYCNVSSCRWRGPCIVSWAWQQGGYLQPTLSIRLVWADALALFSPYGPSNARSFLQECCGCVKSRKERGPHCW